MREKNIRRAAHALYAAQADDKNAILGSKILDKEVRGLVKDQGRALVVLEKILLPYGQSAFEEDEMFNLLMGKLKKKGHRIQDDDTPDDEEYAEEKRKYMEDRLAKVPTLLGMSLSDLPEKEEEEKAPEFTLPDPVEIKGPWIPGPEDVALMQPDFGDKVAEAIKVKPNYDKIFVGVAIGLVTLALLLRSSDR